MTDADIIRIAQESELWDAIGSIARVYGTINPAIIDFARRIRSATIAECAAVCDASDYEANSNAAMAVSYCAAAIRTLEAK